MNAKKWGQILAKQAESLGGKKRKPNTEPYGFDIFPDWFTSAVQESALEKDKQTNKEKDDYRTGVETYLARRKAHRKKTSPGFDDSQYVIKTPFSSPDTDQSMTEPTNMGEYDDFGYESVEYDDPVISTKPTPTSEKLGVPRPGPSTFIQTARYNPQTKQLNIAYTDGTIFPYQDVSPELADQILKKKNYHSPGQTLLSTIFKGHGTTKGDEIDSIEEGM